MPISIMWTDETRMERDLANTEDARAQDYACSLKLLHMQGIVYALVLLVQNN